MSGLYSMCFSRFVGFGADRVPICFSPNKSNCSWLTWGTRDRLLSAVALPKTWQSSIDWSVRHVEHSLLLLMGWRTACCKAAALLSLSRSRSLAPGSWRRETICYLISDLLVLLATMGMYKSISLTWRPVPLVLFEAKLEELCIRFEMNACSSYP